MSQNISVTGHDNFDQYIKENILYIDDESLKQSGDIEYVPYGTAGFRGHSEKIKPLLYKVAFCAGLRSFITNTNTGIMVTASHNPIQDNGVKIVGGQGEMLNPEWEKIFEKFVNNHTHPPDIYRNLVHQLYYMPPYECPKSYLQIGADHPGRVVIGCDTRPSSEEFVRLLKQGLDYWNPLPQGLHINLGVLTTPALHYMVSKATEYSNHPDEDFVVPLTDYYDKLLIDGFISLNKSLSSTTQDKKCYDPSSLVVDCANGVGQKTMQYLIDNTEFRKYLPLKLINTSSQPTDILNHECGADFVKTKQLPPRGANELKKRYASLDGDADRVVYFFLEKSPNPPSGGDGINLELRLLDGDKILTLYAKYLIDILKRYNLFDQLSLGAVQTAYANGASTEFLQEELGLKNIDCVNTGVKNLHAKALNYDLGVYFEANGHGTIWVSSKARALFSEHKVEEILQLLGILNNHTGDAVSDILIAETILKHYDWDVEQWYEMYRDRPNALIKVEIKDKNSVVTTDADRKCLRPNGIQEYIDELVSNHGPGTRSFVRASGTENVVRVYAEARDKQLAERLAQLIGEKVIELCNSSTNEQH